MLRDDAVLLDMIEAARKALDFTKGLAKSAFMKDEKTQAAVLHQITVLGEAAKRLSQDFRRRHSQIRWKDIAGMRDIIIHQYDRVNLQRVWNALSRDIPELIAKLSTLLPRDEK